MPTPIEDEFIACVRESTTPIGLGTTLALRMDLAYAFEGARLVERDGYHCCVTPRGADLLATADAIGYDPQAPVPEPTPKTCPCPDCKGEGRVPVSRSSNRTISELVHEEPATIVELPGWDMTCGTCEGKKVVPQPRRMRMVYSWAQPRRMRMVYSWAQAPLQANHFVLSGKTYTLRTATGHSLTFTCTSSRPTPWKNGFTHIGTLAFVRGHVSTTERDVVLVVTGDDRQLGATSLTSAEARRVLSIEPVEGPDVPDDRTVSGFLGSTSRGIEPLRTESYSPAQRLRATLAETRELVEALPAWARAAIDSELSFGPPHKSSTSSALTNGWSALADLRTQLARLHGLDSRATLETIVNELTKLPTPVKPVAPTYSVADESSGFTLDFSNEELSVKQAARRVERELITRALARTSGNRTRAAQLLELSHRALLYKIRDYGIGASLD